MRQIAPARPAPATIAPCWRPGDVCNSEQNSGQPEEHTNSGLPTASLPYTEKYPNEARCVSPIRLTYFCR
jgi:hypothetical protein